MDGHANCSESVNHVQVLGDLPRFDEISDEGEGLEDGEVRRDLQPVQPPTSSCPIDGVGLVEPAATVPNCWQGKRSFVDVVYNDSLSVDLEIPAMVDGVLNIDDKVFDVLCQEWIYTVRAKSSYPLGFYAFGDLLLSWKTSSFRLFRTSSSKDEFLIKMSNKEDFNLVLAKRSISFKGIVIRFQAYDPLSTTFTDSPKAPVWISMPGLSPILYHKDIFESIGAGFGKLVKVDRFTAKKLRMEEARVCVELNLLEPMPKVILINSVLGPVEQVVRYLNVPSYCNHCLCLGHLSVSCKLLPKVRKEWREKKVDKGQKERVTDPVYVDFVDDTRSGDFSAAGTTCLLAEIVGNVAAVGMLDSLPMLFGGFCQGASEGLEIPSGGLNGIEGVVGSNESTEVPPIALGLDRQVFAGMSEPELEAHTEAVDGERSKQRDVNGFTVNGVRYMCQGYGEEEPTSEKQKDIDHVAAKNLVLDALASSCFNMEAIVVERVQSSVEKCLISAPVVSSEDLWFLPHQVHEVKSGMEFKEDTNDAKGCEESDSKVAKEILSVNRALFNSMPTKGSHGVPSGTPLSKKSPKAVESVKHVPTIQQRQICTNCYMNGHLVDQCWELHLEFRPSPRTKRRAKNSSAGMANEEQKSDAKASSVALAGDIMTVKLEGKVVEKVSLSGGREGKFWSTSKSGLIVVSSESEGDALSESEEEVAWQVSASLKHRDIAYESKPRACKYKNGALSEDKPHVEEVRVNAADYRDASGKLSKKVKDKSGRFIAAKRKIKKSKIKKIWDI